MNRRTFGEVNLTSQAPAAPQYYEEPACFVLDVTLTANQEKLEQGVFLDGDGDFALQAIASSSTGAYDFRMRMPNGRYWPQSYAKHSNVLGSGVFAMPIEPPLQFASGGKLSVDVKDTSGAGNTVQIIFRGVKRYRVG